MGYAEYFVLFHRVLGFSLRGKKPAAAALMLLLAEVCFLRQIQGMPLIFIPFLSWGIQPGSLVCDLMEFLFILCMFQKPKVSAIIFFQTACESINALFCVLVRWKAYAQDSDDLFAAMISLGLFVVLAVFLREKRKSVCRTIQKIPAYLYLGAVLFIGIAGTYYITISNLLDTELRVRLYNRLLTAGTDVIILLLFIVCIVLFWSKNQLEEWDEMNQRLLKAQAEQWRQQNESQKELRSFRHDFSAHIQAMEACSAQKEYDKLDAYLQKLGTVRENMRYISTNHVIGDAIFNEYDRKGKAEHVRLIVVGTFPDQLRMEDIDFCVILSNVISNAYEAALQVSGNGEREIRVKIGSCENRVFLTVQNPACGPPAPDGSRILSTKEDQENHGFGIQNIKRALKKYNGTVKWEVDESENHGISVITKVTFDQLEQKTTT